MLLCWTCWRSALGSSHRGWDMKRAFSDGSRAPPSGQRGYYEKTWFKSPAVKAEALQTRHDARRHAVASGHVTGIARKRSPSEKILPRWIEQLLTRCLRCYAFYQVNWRYTLSCRCTWFYFAGSLCFQRLFNEIMATGVRCHNPRSCKSIQ